MIIKDPRRKKTLTEREYSQLIKSCIPDVRTTEEWNKVYWSGIDSLSWWEVYIDEDGNEYHLYHDRETQVTRYWMVEEPKPIR
jgi:hypothetical protein